MDKKELRKEILQRLYEEGYRYITKGSWKRTTAHTKKPIKLFLFDDLFEDVTFEDEEPLSITKELGFIDWSTIPKDTKVLVSNDGEKWYKKHFKEYKEDCVEPFVVYCFGNTSWTSETITAYKYCKLAEEEEQ